MKDKSVLNLVIIAWILIPWHFYDTSGHGKLSIYDQGYFEMPGLDVNIFNDYNPNSHQSGITIVQSLKK